MLHSAVHKIPKSVLSCTWSFICPFMYEWMYCDSEETHLIDFDGFTYSEPLPSVHKNVVLAMLSVWMYVWTNVLLASTWTMRNFIKFQHLKIYASWIDALRILTFQLQKYGPFKGALYKMTIFWKMAPMIKIHFSNLWRSPLYIKLHRKLKDTCTSGPHTKCWLCRKRPNGSDGFHCCSISNNQQWSAKQQSVLFPR
jgi:hypothetical protein